MQLVSLEKIENERRKSNHDILCDSVMRNIDLAKNCSKIMLRVMMRGRGKYVWRVGGVGTVIELQYHLPYKTVFKKKKEKPESSNLCVLFRNRKETQTAKKDENCCLWAAGNR